MFHSRFVSPVRSLLLLGTVALATSLQAQIAYDTFESYALGQSVNGKSGGVGWAGSWATSATNTVVDAGLSFNAGGIVRGGGNAVNLTSASTYAMVRDVFESLNTSGADYYMSMAFQIVSESSSGTVGSGTSYFAWGADDDLTYVHNQTLGGTNASNVIARVGDASEYRASTAANLKYGTTYFLVVEYGGWDSGVNGYTTATSWVYADDGEGGTTIVSATKTVVSETTGSKGIIGLNLRTHFITEDTHLLFDDIVFGDSLASVTGAIPEPATYAVFAGLAILGISILRRKRRS